MTILAALAAASIMTVASAQQGQMQGQSGFNLPDGCRSAAQASGQGNMMQKMDGGMSQQMQDIMAQMTETQKVLHQVMMDMHGPMMMGMLAKDADVAWICSMIPHHQGAIAMARACLQGADNAESKELAQETIQSNQKELEKLTAWVEKNARSESKDESGSK
jgi:uncharacterized protein (DUF305 family)